MTIDLTQTHSTEPVPQRSLSKGRKLVAASLLAFAAAGFGGQLGAVTDLAAVSSDDSGRAAASAEPGKPVVSPGDERNLAKSALERRMTLLSRELSLDAGQQSAVRRLLLQQREQTLKVWSDDAVPSAVRIKATQGVADRTAEQIRLLLTDEQRGRYMQQRNREAEQPLASGELESWMRGSSPNGLPASHELSAFPADKGTWK
jgi:hypothetical protein